ncbi:unnamed protein product [Adineta ricciae]|uniref:Uncharacterized protein n=1 Tax=Adineta ricciae TaxID=249248 RepID=A0A815TZK6_ADIRI|nr:unnamed protein product [Adineta ricciae]CAF1508927.1 unnamed protein product [Adineta ricciae]
MIFVWVLLLFSGIYPNIQSLSCINLGYIAEVPINTFDRNAFKVLLDGYEMDGDHFECLVKMEVYHHLELLKLQFSKLLQQEPIAPSTVRLLTITRYIDKDDTMTGHVLTSACSNSDSCDKQFILDHVDWLVQIKFDKFFSISFQLLIPDDDELHECHLVQCGNGFCSAQWTHLETDIKQSCSNMPRAQFQARNDFNFKTREETALYGLFCGYPECNSLDIVTKFQVNVKENYNILPLRNALGFRNESDESMTTASSALNITFSQYLIETMPNVSSPSSTDTIAIHSSMINNASAMHTSASTLVTAKVNSCTIWQFWEKNIIVSLAVLIILLVIY